MLQKEVAQRIVARPPKMSLLAVSVQFYSQPEIIEYVDKKNFWPIPKVDSAIIKLEVTLPPCKQSGGRGSEKLSPPWPLHFATAFCGVTPEATTGSRQRRRRDPAEAGEVNEKEFFQLVKFGFSAKRKMLKNNLAAGFRIAQKEVEEKIKVAGFNPKIRAQELSLKDWLKIFDVFKCG